MQWDDIQIYNFYYNLNFNLNSSVSDHNNGKFQVTYDHPRLFSYCKLFHLGVGWKRNIKRMKKVFLLSFNAIKIDELSHTFMFHILSPFFTQDWNVDDKWCSIVLTLDSLQWKFFTSFKRVYFSIRALKHFLTHESIWQNFSSLFPARSLNLAKWYTKRRRCQCLDGTRTHPRTQFLSIDLSSTQNIFLSHENFSLVSLLR